MSMIARPLAFSLISSALLIERLGFPVSLLVAIDRCQIIQAVRRVRVVWPSDFRADFQCRSCNDSASL